MSLSIQSDRYYKWSVQYELKRSLK